MADANIKQVLQDLGLSETESRVYTSMLELGPQSVQNIAKKARVSRTAAYEIISSLQHKGIASTFQKGKKKFFSAEDPDRLYDYFKVRMESMKGQLGTFKRLVPELRLLQGEDKPKVRYFSGEEGVHALFRDVMSLGAKEMLEVADIDQVYEHVDHSTIMTARENERMSIVAAKVLHKGSVRNVHKYGEYRTLPDSFGDLSGLIWIYENRVAFMKFIGEIEVIIIESKVFSDTLRTMFNFAWGAAKPSVLPTKK